MAGLASWSYVDGMRRLALVVVGLFGCGPGLDAGEPLTCGEQGPVQLLDDVAWGRPAYAGERLMAFTGPVFPATSEAFEVRAVGRCGEDPVLLEPGSVWALGEYKVVGDHIVRVHEDGGVARLDRAGQEHPIFERNASCLQEVAGGLVALDADGTVWFHPDPQRPEVSPRAVARGTVVSELDWVPFVDAADCSTADTERPVVDGEGILIAERGGALVRIALPSEEREVIVEGPVGEFMVLEDPRYLLWRGGSSLHPEDDCCSVRLLDRETGVSTRIGASVIVGDVGRMGEWLSISSLSNDLEYYEDFLNYVTGTTIRIDGWWRLIAPLSRSELLIGEVGEDNIRILDVSTGAHRPIDFPEPRWPHRVYDDGVVAQRLTDSEDWSGDLLLLPFGSDSPRIIATDIPNDWVRSQNGNLLYIDRGGALETGTLVHVTAAGERRELAEGVSMAFIPHHATVRERNEVVYSISTGPDRGLWRLVLP